MFKRLRDEYKEFLKSPSIVDFDNNPTPFDFLKRCYPEIAYPLLDWNNLLICKFSLNEMSIDNLEAMIVLSEIRSH